MSLVNKEKQLKMSLGKANYILRKKIMFNLAQKLNIDICYRCNLKIDNIKDFSIEHKKNWENSKDPINLFFDINNIAFSHLSCNIKASVKKNKISYPPGEKWCWSCKEFKKEKDFRPSAIKQRTKECKECNSKYKRDYRKIKKGL